MTAALTNRPRHNRILKTWHKAPTLLDHSRWLANQTNARNSLPATLRNRYEEAIHHVVVMPVTIGVPVKGNHDVRPVDIDHDETILAGDGGSGHARRRGILWCSGGTDDHLPGTVISRLQPVVKV